MISRESKDKAGKYNQSARSHDILSDFYRLCWILKRRWLPAITIFSFILALSTFIASKKESIYRAQGQLMFNQDKASSLIGLTPAEDGSAETGGWMNADRVLDTEIRVLLSEPILQRTINAINQENLQGQLLNTADLKAELTIKNVLGTNVLLISYQNPDPEIAALVVNQLMNTYIQNNLSDSRSTAVVARRFITEQLPKLRQNVVSADTALRNFKEKFQIPDLNAARSALVTNTERIQSQIDSAETELAKLNAQSVAVQKKLGMNSEEAMAVSSFSQYSVVQGLLDDLQGVQRKLADARSRYQPRNPAIENLQEKEAQIKAQLQVQLAKSLPGQKVNYKGKFQLEQTQQALMTDLIQAEVNRIGLINQVAALNQQNNFYQKQAATLPKLEQQQRELERNLSASESTYEALLKSLQEVRIKENQVVGNVRIIESALVPAIPITNSQTSTILAGSLCGILLVGALIYVLEVRDKKIKTIQEARDLFDYKLLGTIPIFNRTARNVRDKHTSERIFEQLPAIAQPRSAISESYRMLQANLKYLNAFNAAKVIVVTSSVPKEGKSTLCANLAATMAQIGQRVLIIDADMHRPTQHEIWKVSNHEEGLSNVITEPTLLETKVFHNVIENLNVVTSGFLPPNPLAVIESKRMATFLKESAKNYDYVFIDTPPLASTADAVTLGRIVDGVLIVIRPGVADSDSSNLAKEYLEQSGQKVLGIVVNGVLPENEPHRSLSHYYSRN
jgi:capsular exopolysaccharide synthesis family protein